MLQLITKDGCDEMRELTPALPRRWSILRPVGGVTLIFLLVKTVGFGEKVVVARYLGTTQAADCYYAAFSVVWTLVFMVRELVQPACLPVYTQVVQSGNERLRRQVFSVLALGLGGFIALTAGALAIWPGAAVRLVAPGFSSEAQAETAGLIRAMSFGIAGLTFMGLTQTVLNAHQRFCWAAWGELAFRVILVGGVAAGFTLSGANHVGLAIGIGAAVGVLLHATILRSHVRLCLPTLNRQTVASLREMSVLAAPLIFGLVFSHISQLVDGVLASTLSTGRLSALSYAKKLTDAIVLMGPVALATVMFARFSSLAAAGQLDQMRTLLVRCVRVLLVVSMPVALLVVALRYPIVRVLFERGKFGAASTDLTVAALMFYGMGIVAFALEGLLVGTFYALKDMKTPVIIGVVGAAVDIVLAWVLMKRLDHVGIALSIVLIKTVKVIVLGVLLDRRLSLAAGKEIVVLTAGLVAAGVGMALGMTGVDTVCGWQVLAGGACGKWLMLGRAGVLGVVGIGLFVAILRLLQVREVDAAIRASYSAFGRAQRTMREG